MKKLLYITANSKSEEMSASKTVGRAVVNRFLSLHSDFILEEIDLINLIYQDLNISILMEEMSFKRRMP